MYKIGKSKIPWTTHGWSPVVGCNRGCPYCYAKDIVSRFSFPWFTRELEYRLENGIQEDSLWNEMRSFGPAVMHHRLDPSTPEKPSSIFCSPLTDPEYWPDAALAAFFEVVRKNPKHIFLILTKSGSTYYNWPNYGNVAYGYTATDHKSLKDQARKRIIGLGQESKSFVSLEPLHGFLELEDLKAFDWVIVGPENGSREGKPEPNKRWFDEIKDYCEHLPLFEKPEVAEIVNRPLVQEFALWHPNYKIKAEVVK